MVASRPSRPLRTVQAVRKPYTLKLDLPGPSVALVFTLEADGPQLVVVGTREGDGDEVARLAQWLTSGRATRQLLQAGLYACGKLGEPSDEEPDE